MGYRSHTAMCIEGKDVPALIAAHRMNDRFKPDTHKECMAELVINKEGVYLNAEDWKWYESYEDIQWFERLWSEAAEMNDAGADLHGTFTRVGEENGDIEERYIGEPDWDRVRIVQGLEVNFPPSDAEAQPEEKAA